MIFLIMEKILLVEQFCLPGTCMYMYMSGCGGGRAPSINVLRVLVIDKQRSCSVKVQRQLFQWCFIFTILISNTMQYNG